MPKSPLNLAVSSPMVMKLGRDVLWIKIFSNWEKVLMMSLSFVDMLEQLKKWNPLRLFAEYLKNRSELIFTKLMSFLGTYQ